MENIQNNNQEKSWSKGGSTPANGREFPKKQAAEIEAKLKNYTGPDGLTTKQLEIGLWYVEHKQLLGKILYGFLILVGAVSWIYTIYGFAYYFTRGMKEDEISAGQLVKTNYIGHNYIFQIGAKQLAIAPVGIIKSADKKYDFYAQIKNENQKWWAEFDYYFVADGRQTERALKTEGYIFPLEAKYLLALAQDFPYEPSSARLVIENIRWHRINQHLIPDWDTYYRSHLDFVSSDIKLIPSNSSPLSEKLNLNQLSFKTINKTAYNYWQVGFAILLYNGDNLTYVNRYTLNDFMSEQERIAEISWPGDIGWVDRIELVPEINIMNDDIYIKYEGGVGQEK